MVLNPSPVVDRRWVRVGSRWCLQTRTGVVIGRSWQPQPPAMSADAELLQQLMSGPGLQPIRRPRVIELDTSPCARVLRALERLLPRNRSTRRRVNP